MELHPVDIIIALANIIVLFILLRLILWKPVNNYLSARIERVNSEREKAEKLRQDADDLRSEYERKLGDLEAQGIEIRRASQAKASVEAEEILSDARLRSENMIREAHDSILEEKERAITNSRYEVARLATDIAAGILKREISPEDTMNTVEEFFLETR